MLDGAEGINLICGYSDLTCFYFRASVASLSLHFSQHVVGGGEGQGYKAPDCGICRYT
jgi:hypothetical protein